MSTVLDFGAVDPLLRKLRDERFTAGPSELQPCIDQLYERIEYALIRALDGKPVDLSPFSVTWASEAYWNANTQEEVDRVIVSWIPVLAVAKVLGGFI